MSASRRPAPSAPRVWMKSTVIAASVHQENPALDAEKVKPADNFFFFTLTMIEVINAVS